MPTYEYLCTTCQHRFETWQKMTDDPLTECPECGAHIRRVLFPAGIVFKGSGFYKTDHGNGAMPASNGHSNGENGSESKASESKSSAENGANGSSKSTSSESSKSDSSTPAGTK
ncbi:MAG TPA: FmdB family zinc ribbon protein [Ktedonobacteraceae bacterium]|nr:FmdB family zinc ribbon protein [Ktedonobacteraceae bacterium]